MVTATASESRGRRVEHFPRHEASAVTSPSMKGARAKTCMQHRVTLRVLRDYVTVILRILLS